MTETLVSRCLDVAMGFYPKGCNYRVPHGQDWDAAAYVARRKQIEPLVRAVLAEAVAAITSNAA